MATPPIRLKFGNELHGPPVPPAKEPGAIAPEIEPAWFETGEFYPPGCKRIVPETAVSVTMADTPRAHFPSADVCASLDGMWSISCDGHGTRTILHVLSAQRRGEATLRSFYSTTKATSVLWSPDNRRVALTVITGSNRSMVLCVDLDNFTLGDPVYPPRVLDRYFTALQLESPQFVSAYRWTNDGRLVVRGAGRESLPPYATYGYEVLIDAREPGRATMTFLRGFTKLPVASAVANARGR